MMTEFSFFQVNYPFKLNLQHNLKSNTSCSDTKAQFWFLQLHIILLIAYIADLEGASIVKEAILWDPASVALILQKVCKSIKLDMSKLLCHLWACVWR